MSEQLAEIRRAADNIVTSQGEELRVFVFRTSVLHNPTGDESKYVREFMAREDKTGGFTAGTFLPRGWHALSAEVGPNGRTYIVAVRRP